MAEWVYEELQLDRLLMIPAAVPPHKQHQITPASQRLEMLQRAVQDDSRLEISDYEIRRALDVEHSKPSYTLHTLQHFAQYYSGAELWWVIGMDSLYQLHSWYGFEQLPNYARFAVLPRPLTQAPELEHYVQTHLPMFQGKLDFLEMPELTIASSHIRARLQQGKTCRYLLHPAVWAYIQNQGLYSPSA